MKAMLPLLLFGVLVAFLAVSLRHDPSHVPSPLVGLPMPAFSGEHLLQPGIFVNEKDLSDRPMLLNVWATWCQGCIAEHALLMKIAHRYSIPIYGLNYRDERGAALEWLGRYGNPYRLVVYDKDAAIGLDWGVYGAPETFVIDTAGIIRYKHVGILREDVFENDILPLLERGGREPPLSQNDL